MVENMSYLVGSNGEHVQLFPRGDLDTYLKQNSIQKLASIPFHPMVALTSESGVPAIESQPNSEEARAFLNLA